MAIEIVDLPINSMVIFPSVMIQRLPGRVKGKSAGISHGFSHEDHGDMGGNHFPMNSHDILLHGSPATGAARLQPRFLASEADAGAAAWRQC
jgi:hypothetical protein